MDTVIIDDWDRRSTYVGASHFLEKNTVGAILRGFAKTPEKVLPLVKQLLETVEIFQGLKHHPDKRTVKRADIWVATDKTRDDHDCGELKSVLIAEIQKRKMTDVWVHELKYGDIFCQILNRAVAVQLAKGCSHSLILSSAANSNITNDSFARMLNALDEGALVTGLGFDEIKPFVMEGYIMNTCAIWDNLSLMQVNGFDTAAEQLRFDSPYQSTVWAWDRDKRDKSGNPLPPDYTYKKHGVEELATLIKLINTFSIGDEGFQCIAPIPGTGDWNKPDPETDPEGAARFANKMGTKWQRMLIRAHEMHADISIVGKGVMKKYRRHTATA